ncbi:endoplasmic reticulum vesicle transporter-domain-containing protein [Catenaria anguillulae PL171]|uniref:Endoplasmic reticulum vesicle transporter-domain-containing protein n=1 Tax=Catenaria anguillulae PL171 TaxID=765915 RepID=A0A1Y2HJB8_9FUNG|nr:endoplasmic reticulum vesicle transporter-domain-containing protein [Catenaria anguillulae PL171]
MRLVKSLSTLDAFPKIDDAFLVRSKSGALTSLVVSSLLCLLAISETARFLAIHHDYKFIVDPTLRQSIDVTVDVTVAMKCEYVTMDVYDVSGTALHVGNTVERIPTLFSTAGVYLHGQRPDGPVAFGAHATSTSAGTPVPADQATACRMRGAFAITKVAGNVHITALGHAYAGQLHVPHEAINFTHRVDQFAFGATEIGATGSASSTSGNNHHHAAASSSAGLQLANPLAGGYEVSLTNFEMYQYFLSIVPSTYTSGSLHLSTNQYAVTDHKKLLTPNSQAEQGIPGIFFRYAFEPIAVSITATGQESLPKFMVRMAGIVGGVYVCMGAVHGVVRWGMDVAQRGLGRVVRI